MTDIIKEKQNSYSFRWGGTGTDMKVYYDDAEDLNQQLAELKNKAVDIKLNMTSFIQIMGSE